MPSNAQATTPLADINERILMLFNQTVGSIMIATRIINPLLLAVDSPYC